MTFAALTPVVSLLMIPLLIAPPGLSQSAAPASAAQSGIFQLKVLDSDGPQVAVNSRSAKGFSIQVVDANGTGVPDAAVALRLPDSGASGLFADGSHSAVAYTDASGKVHLEGVQWNGTAGAMAVRVTATKGEAHAGILIEQTLVNPAAPSLPAPRLEASAAPLRALPAPVAEESAALNTIPASVESVPVRPAIRSSLNPGVSVIRSAEPSVSISNDGGGPAYHGGSSKKKWIILGLTIAAGAGAAFAIMSMSKGGSSAASSSTISIGAPTVSVGHP